MLLTISLSIDLEHNSFKSFIIIFSYLVLSIAITTTSAIVGYYLELYKRTSFKLFNIASTRIERTQTILSLLLPSFVKNRVKEGVRYIAENQGEVTILFCDICDFEAICRDYKPQDLRVFLDNLFKIFDELCEDTGVTKIETVGKTYMACAGLQDSDSELSQHISAVHHTKRTLELALSMIQEVNNIRLNNGSWLHVKIGINTGPVVAGVVGYHKPQFSLVGDTVNTASRMCSTLDSYNSIQISETTYKYLTNFPGVSFEPRKVEAKGKGMMNTFIVTELKLEISDEDEDNGTTIDRNHNIANLSMKITLNSSQICGKSLLNETFVLKFENKLMKNKTLIPKTSWFRHQCNETKREKKFRHNRLKKSYKVILLSLLIALGTYATGLLLSVLEFYFLPDYSNLSIIIGKSVAVGCIVIIVVLHPKIYKNAFYPICVFIMLLLMLSISLFNLIYSTAVSADYTALEIMYIIVILNYSSGGSLILIIFANISVFVP